MSNSNLTVSQAIRPSAIANFSPWEWESVYDKDAADTLYEMFKILAGQYSYQPNYDDYMELDETILLTLGFGGMEPLSISEINELFRDMLISRVY